MNTERVQTRVPPEVADQVAQVEKQTAATSESEAVRRLLEAGLEAHYDDEGDDQHSSLGAADLWLTSAGALLAVVLIVVATFQLFTPLIQSPTPVGVLAVVTILVNGGTYLAREKGWI